MRLLTTASLTITLLAAAVASAADTMSANRHLRHQTRHHPLGRNHRHLPPRRKTRRRHRQHHPQGFNRALALATVLPEKFGRPDYLFAPDPHQKVSDKGRLFNYVRPLATIEPLAVKLGMPVNTPFGFRDTVELNDELTNDKYAGAMIFVAWEHVMAEKAAQDLLKAYGADIKQVPTWAGPDYDSLYIIKITRTPDHAPTAAFTIDHEGLDNQSSSMPTPAPSDCPRTLVPHPQPILINYSRYRWTPRSQWATVSLVGSLIESDSAAAKFLPESLFLSPSRLFGPICRSLSPDLESKNCGSVAHSLKENFMGKKLYVGNLSYDVDSSALGELFAPHGTVESSQIITDRDTGRSKGFGFVEMGSDKEAQDAIAAMNGQDQGGRALTVNEAKPKESRSGGGSGGGSRGGYGGGGGGGGGYGGGGGRGR